jgi:hypothetical protein
VTGFVLGQTEATATTGTESWTTTATTSSNVGSYGITGSGLTAKNGNYVFVQAEGNPTALTINPATFNPLQSMPQQNALYVTVLNLNGTTTTTFIAAGDGTDNDNNKDKKGGQNSGIKKQALPYCN